MTLDRSFTT